MRTLKLVIWDLDETILEGILEEGDKQIHPQAQQALDTLKDRGILQAIASQNPPKPVADAVSTFHWDNYFNLVEADLAPKINKVRRIIETLDIDERDIAFIDEDPFERDSIAAQTHALSCWTIAELTQFLATSQAPLSEESRQRPRMYKDNANRQRDENNAQGDDYQQFLAQCNISINIRPYHPDDLPRVTELLSRTHRMNLGVLDAEQTLQKLASPQHYTTLIAEMHDRYGDMGRCGVMLFEKSTSPSITTIESLAISCRTRARGLSLALFIALLRHESAQADQYVCKYVNTGDNRPLRMLLMAARFKPEKGTNQLNLTADQLHSIEQPTWTNIHYS